MLNPLFTVSFMFKLHEICYLLYVETYVSASFLLVYVCVCVGMLYVHSLVYLLKQYTTAPQLA